MESDGVSSETSSIDQSRDANVVGKFFFFVVTQGKSLCKLMAWLMGLILIQIYQVKHQAVAVAKTTSKLIFTQITWRLTQQ